jgi:hypothetical protein
VFQGRLPIHICFWQVDFESQVLFFVGDSMVRSQHTRAFLEYSLHAKPGVGSNGQNFQ